MNVKASIAEENEVGYIIFILQWSEAVSIFILVITTKERILPLISASLSLSPSLSPYIFNYPYKLNRRMIWEVTTHVHIQLIWNLTRSDRQSVPTVTATRLLKNFL